MDKSTDNRDEQQLLNQIEEGMRVYDRDNNDIGAVERVYLGGASDRADVPGEGSGAAQDSSLPGQGLIMNALPIFEVDQLPAELRERLLNRGFVRINSAGILAADRYLLPEQIDRVQDRRVILRVARKDLIKA